MGEEIQIGVNPSYPSRNRVLKVETYEIKQAKRWLSTPCMIFLLFEFGCWHGLLWIVGITGINILSHLFDLFFSSTWERFATVHRVAREVDAISILEEAVEDGVNIGRVAEDGAMPQ
jgi:hypothetical protein